MAEDPPTFWVPLGQLTCMVRYVDPDQTTDTCIAPVPVKPTLLERWAGGSITPWWLPAPKGGDATVVVVVGATTGAVVVVAVACAGGTVVGAVAVAPCVDVSAVPAVLAFVATGDVVVVERAVDADRDEPPEPPEPPAPPRVPCESLDCVLAIPCAPAPRATRFGLPDVATSSAIRARDTARMTHQLGRPRATLGRRPSEDPVP